MLPKFYFINLDRSEDRLKHMNKFFRKIEKKTNMKPRFQRIKAFDGKTENVDDFSNLELSEMYHKREADRKAIGPEFGCTYSHIKAMKSYLDDTENTDDIAFICEDDLELFKIKKEFFMDILNQVIKMTRKCDLIAISCVGSPIIIGPMAEKLKNPTFLGYEANRGKLYGTGCYMISRKLAKIITDRHWKNNKLIIDENHSTMVADHFIYPQNKETSFLIPSLFAIKPENDSYIHSQHLNMHDSIQKLMFEMWNKFNVASKSEVAIISNNDWGEDYYIQKQVKYNTPTIGTKINPIDYVEFVENFEEYLKIEPQETKLNNVNYPVGKLVNKDKEVIIHFCGEESWMMALRHWEDRKKKLPANKSDILFKLCDRKFNGELTTDLLKRFYKIDIIKKVVFLSEHCEFREKYLDKKYDAKLILIKYCDNENKCCPDGKQLFKLCGVN